MVVLCGEGVTVEVKENEIVIEVDGKKYKIPRSEKRVDMGDVEHYRNNMKIIKKIVDEHIL